MNDATPQRPPVAARKPSSVSHHGMTVDDHYAWLRDPGYPAVEDQEVLAHLAAEPVLPFWRCPAPSCKVASRCPRVRTGCVGSRPAPIAQSVERLHGKEKVNGSIPFGGSGRPARTGRLPRRDSSAG